MYRRNQPTPTTPPPGYGGTTFGERPVWPPQTAAPPDLRASHQSRGYVPFASGKRPVATPMEEPDSAPTPQETIAEEASRPIQTEQTEQSEQPRETQPPQNTGLFGFSEDTLLLFGVLLLLTHGEDGKDLLPILSILLLL